MLNQTHLPKHQTLSSNNQFSQRIWYAEYHSAHAYMAWSHEFRKSEISLETGNLSGPGKEMTCHGRHFTTLGWP